MNFIFPKNYTFKTKLFGFIDYTTAIFNGITAFIVFQISNLFFPDFNKKIYFFIITYFPLFLFSIFGFQGENIIFVIKYLYKFLSRQSVYLYRKKHIDLNINSKKI